MCLAQSGYDTVSAVICRSYQVLTGSVICLVTPQWTPTLLVLGFLMTFERLAVEHWSRLETMSSSSQEERGYGGDLKHGETYKEVMHDHDIARVTTQDARHHAQLTEEELVLEKKLRRKIDSLIMPLVIMV
ncbi:hypothetical protein LTR12_003645 [Friedmanniomyces endolithicus]|nr:hypothetical protein LTR74_016293 [Friedmanniomyces endolithicus]KAK1821949.1 hypothetical protein LTR12_003645 [Friedmanniomyces endolithicus]